MSKVIPLIVLLAQAALSHPLVFDDMKHLSEEPVLSPRSNEATSFDAIGAFNPAVVFHKGKYVMLYRALNAQGRSSIGRAESTDGIHFQRDGKSTAPLLQSETDYEKDGGLEDPRLTKIGSTFYLTYTGYNKKAAQLCLATSADLRRWRREGIIMPAGKGKWNVHWTKSGAIVPAKINNTYWMYYMGDAANGGTDQTGLACSSDLLHWTDATPEPVLARRPGEFDSRVVEPGPAPIITKDGILLIYNGADDNLVYRTGWALFDRKDPSRLLARSAKPIFAPERLWEREGAVPNVVFVEGMVQKGKRYLFYYGAADKFTGVAESRLIRR